LRTRRGQDRPKRSRRPRPTWEVAGWQPSKPVNAKLGWRNSSPPAGRRSCFAEFWAAPDLKWIPSIIADDVVGYWPGGRIVRGRAEYMQALEELLGLLPDLRLEVPEHTMSADGEFGFSR
jgi:hypothetical protein